MIKTPVEIYTQNIDAGALCTGSGSPAPKREPRLETSDQRKKKEDSK